MARKWRHSDTPEQRFWNQVERGGPTECWTWVGWIETDGYGAIVIDGAKWRAHRLAWTIHNGPIPEGLAVLHRCDTPSCVNPSHLFLGTHLDNMRDMAAKGRQRRGHGIIRQRRGAGIYEVQVPAGKAPSGRPRVRTRTVHGTIEDAERVRAELLAEVAAGEPSKDGRTTAYRSPRYTP